MPPFLRVKRPHPIPVFQVPRPHADRRDRLIRRQPQPGQRPGQDSPERSRKRRTQVPEIHVVVVVLAVVVGARFAETVALEAGVEIDEADAVLVELLGDRVGVEVIDLLDEVVHGGAEFGAEFGLAGGEGAEALFVAPFAATGHGPELGKC